MRPKTIVIKATAANGKITAENGAVNEAEILSQGTAKSEGVLIISGDKVFYIAIPIESIKNILDLIGQAADLAASGILPSNEGGNITSSTFAAQMQALAQQAHTLKEGLQ